MASTTPIALVGYRGTGKTTIARLLAGKIGFDWVDADVEVELRAGKSIAAIFEESGEASFRDLESEVVAELCQRKQTVLALGGGAILRENNREHIATCAQVIWLQATAETIGDRILADPTTGERRPNLTNRGGRHEIEQLLAQRDPFYRSCATLEVDTENKDPAAIADEIVSMLGG